MEVASGLCPQITRLPGSDLCLNPSSGTWLCDWGTSLKLSAPLSLLMRSRLELMQGLNKLTCGVHRRVRGGRNCLATEEAEV